MKTKEGINLKIAKVVDRVLPPNGVGTYREQQRLELNQEIFGICKEYAKSLLPSDEQIEEMFPMPINPNTGNRIKSAIAYSRREGAKVSRDKILKEIEK